MAVEVSAFSAMARSEFMNQLMGAYSKPVPADIGPLVDEYSSKARVETHTYMSNVPRLRLFKGYTPGQRLKADAWTVTNHTYRAGPIVVQKNDLDDDQVGGYLRAISALPQQAQKDIKYKVLQTFAGGTTNLCFDGTAMFADSHTVGSGDNLMTTDNSGNDGVTHKVIAVITDGPAKPMLFQNREPLKELRDDYSPNALKQREFEYWADTRFGVSCAAWFTAIHVTITDTPTLAELDTQLTAIANRFRTFTLPKGADVDDVLYFHEGWVPEEENFTILCNLGLAQLLYKLRTTELIAAGTGGAVVNNQWRSKFRLIPTSALGA
jgi:phage major head subunit gpT-like protein